MPTRRDFIRLSALATAAGCTLGRINPAFAASPGESSGLIYGVQLFMVRRQATQDLAAVFRQIHQVGFAQVELYPIAYNRTDGKEAWRARAPAKQIAHRHRAKSHRQ